MAKKKLQIFTHGRHIKELAWKKYKYLPNGNTVTAYRADTDIEIDAGPQEYVFAQKGQFILMTDRGDLFRMDPAAFNETHEEIGL